MAVRSCQIRSIKSTLKRLITMKAQILEGQNFAAAYGREEPLQYVKFIDMTEHDNSFQGTQEKSEKSIQKRNEEEYGS